MDGVIAMTLRRALFVGDSSHPEFAPAIEWLRRHTDLMEAASVNQRLEGSVRGDGESTDEPDLIILAASRSGQFSGESVEQLHRRYPLARLVGLLGSWCEGESRTGKPWPGVMRLYWYQWEPQFVREIGGDVQEGVGSWRLPRTATDVEHLLRARPNPDVPAVGTVMLDTDDALAFEALTNLLSQHGYTVLRWEQNGGTLPPVQAVIWMPRIPSDLQFERLRKLAEQAPTIRCLAILGFPRLDDIERARTAGATVVLGKPFLIEDLLWHIQGQPTFGTVKSEQTRRTG